MPDLCVIIVSYNTRLLLMRCLASLTEASAQAGLATEVIVVDNGSVDGSGAAVGTAFPAVRVITSQVNLGFAGANNLAFPRSVAPVTLLLNSDAFIDAEALRRATQLLRTAPEVGVVGMRIVNLDGTFQAAYGRFPTFWDDLCISLGLDRVLPFRQVVAARIGPVDWVHGACMFVRTSALAQVGALDERFFMYSEEVDWCRRFWSFGWEVWYLGDVTVTHVGGASRETDLRRRTALYRGRLGLRRRFSGPFASLFLWLGIILGLVARIFMRAFVGAVLHRRLGRQSPQSDWALAREIARMDPLARWAVS